MIFELESELKGVSFIGDSDSGNWFIGKRFMELFDKFDKKDISSKVPDKVGKIVLNLGRKCNFACSYCLVSELKNQEGVLTRRVGKKVLERVEELDFNEKHIVLHGSEPLKNYSIIKDLLEFNRMVLGEKISFSLQTNGTLLDKEKLNFLLDYKVGIGISLDGEEKHHNLQRPYSDGKPSYNDVVHSIKETRNSQGNISTITVVTQDNVNDLLSISESFEKLDLESVLFAPVSPIVGKIFEIPNQKELFLNMTKVVERYVKKTEIGEPTIKIRNLRDYLRIFFREKTNSNCLQCGSGKSQPILTIDFNGEIYPCDFFWGKKDYEIGNIFEMSLKDALISSKNMRVFRDIDKIEPCASNCNWKRFCGGGCPGSNVSSNRGLNKNSIYCEYNKSMFDYIAKNIPLWHKKGLIGKLIS